MHRLPIVDVLLVSLIEIVPDEGLCIEAIHNTLTGHSITGKKSIYLYRSSFIDTSPQVHHCNLNGIDLTFLVAAKISIDDFGHLSLDEDVEVLVTIQTKVVLENRWKFPSLVKSIDVSVYDRTFLSQFRGTILTSSEQNRPNSILLAASSCSGKTSIACNLPTSLGLPVIFIRSGYVSAKSFTEGRSCSDLLEEAFKTAFLLQPSVIVFDDLEDFCPINSNTQATLANDVAKVMSIAY